MTGFTKLLAATLLVLAAAPAHAQATRTAPPAPARAQTAPARPPAPPTAQPAQAQPAPPPATGAAMPPEPPVPPGTRTLYLVRHGSAFHHPKANDYVANGLDSLGRVQAAYDAAWLRHLPVHFTSMTSSMFARARESADIMGQIMSVNVWRDTLLNEVTPGSTHAPLLMNGPEFDAADSADARLQRAWDEYTQPSAHGDRHDVLVCHGNVIRWFTCKALGVDTRQWPRMDIANGSITIITVQPDGSVHLVAYDDLSALPINNLSWTGPGPGWQEEETMMLK
jgi:serine/threonine-protein phosphatase PGAM5